MSEATSDLQKAVQTVLQAQKDLEAVSPQAAGVKPGYQTSEFWLTALHSICALVAQSGAIQGFQDPTTKATTLGSAVMSLAAYIWSRTKAKA